MDRRSLASHTPTMRAHPQRSFLSPWLVVSAVAHALLALGTAGAGLIAGGGIADGDGFGGESIELEVSGPNDGATHGARVPSADLFTEPAVPASPLPQEAVEESEAAMAADGALAVAAQDIAREPREAVESQSPVAGAADPEEEAPRPIPVAPTPTRSTAPRRPRTRPRASTTVLRVRARARARPVRRRATRRT